jgi:hypothetical protein
VADTPGVYDVLATLVEALQRQRGLLADIMAADNGDCRDEHIEGVVAILSRMAALEGRCADLLKGGRRGA